MKSPDITPAIEDNRDDLAELYGRGVVPGENGVDHPGSMGDALAKMAKNYEDGVDDTKAPSTPTSSGVPPEIKALTAEHRKKAGVAGLVGSQVIRYVKGREEILGGRTPR